MREIVASLPLQGLYTFFALSFAVVGGYFSYRIRKSGIRFARLIGPILAIGIGVFGAKTVVDGLIYPWIEPDILVNEINRKLPRKLGDGMTWRSVHSRGDTLIQNIVIDDPAVSYADFKANLLRENGKLQETCTYMKTIFDAGLFQTVEVRYFVQTKPTTVSVSATDCQYGTESSLASGFDRG